MYLEVSFKDNVSPPTNPNPNSSSTQSVSSNTKHFIEESSILWNSCRQFFVSSAISKSYYTYIKMNPRNPGYNSNKFNKMYFLMKGYLYSCIHTIVFHLQLIYMLDGDHSCNYHHTIWNQYLFLVLRSTPHKRFGLKITMSQWLINLLILLIKFVYKG